MPLRRQQPRHISRIRQYGDLIVTVCDRAREELGPLPPCQQSGLSVAMRQVGTAPRSWRRPRSGPGSGRHIVMAEGAGDPVCVWGTSPGWVQGCWWLAGVGQQLIR